MASSIDTLGQDIPHAAGKQSQTQGHLAFIENFRAIAIILVVVSHCNNLAFGSFIGTPSPFDFIISLFSGATALFVFISGFLFHHVFYARFDFGPFMMGKFKKLIVPYAVVTFVLVMIWGFLWVDPDTEPLGAIDIFNTFVIALAAGNAGVSTWYVPFITIVFLLSPLFIAFIKTRPSIQLTIVAIAFAIGFAVNRSPGNSDDFQSLLYFVFFYLFGILCSVHRDPFMRVVSRSETTWLAFGLALLLSILQMPLVGWPGDFYGAYFEYRGVNLQYLQKVAQIMVFCSLFSVMTHWGNPFSKALANDSFGIFLSHSIVILLLERVLGGNIWGSGIKFLDYFAYGFVVIVLSWGLVWAVKKLAPEYSRTIIGA